LEKFGFIWEEIKVEEIKSFLGKSDILCVYGKEFFFIEIIDKVPDYIRFDSIIKGKWYKK
jgi:hypothetical protein